MKAVVFPGQGAQYRGMGKSLFPQHKRLVQKRGELMSKADGGRMLAVLGVSQERIKQLLKNNGLDVDIANYNIPT